MKSLISPDVCRFILKEMRNIVFTLSTFNYNIDFNGSIMENKELSKIM